MKTLTPTQIDAVLPQTQCGLCGHGGCMPYAKAIIENEAEINLCPPGGIPTLRALGKLTAIDPTPYLNDMASKAKTPTLAVIREHECIGCTKCIQVCPVDAIIGAAKQMHAIITDQCTGCELCVPACPVDCIDLTPASYTMIDKTRADEFRRRLTMKTARSLPITDTVESLTTPVVSTRKSYVELAIERAKLKKRKDTNVETQASKSDYSKGL